MKKSLAGLCGGLLATIPMTVVMQVLHRWPYPERDPLPPGQISEWLAHQSGFSKHMDNRQTELLTAVNHFGFGAGMGAVYALLFTRIQGNPVVKGALWGGAVWGMSYQGWLPAANVLTPATKQSKRRNFLMIAAHLVWGITTAVTAERLRKE